MSTLKVGNISNVAGTKSSTTDVMVDSLVNGGIVIGMPLTYGAATSMAGNYIIGSRFKCRKTQYITEIGISLYQAQNASKIKFAIYSGDTAPTTLLAQTNEITLNSTTDSDNDVIGTIVTPIIVTRGTTYWLVFISDGTQNLYYQDNGNRIGLGGYVVRTYASGFPTPFGLSLTAGGKYCLFAL